MSEPERLQVDRIVGVYNADGSILGELRYLVRRTFRNTHCELCDITHGRVRKKDEFAALQRNFSVPIDVVHLDERSADLTSFTSGRVPCVVAETPGGYQMLLQAGDLARCHGDVDRFVDALHAALGDPPTS